MQDARTTAQREKSILEPIGFSSSRFLDLRPDNSVEILTERRNPDSTLTDGARDFKNLYMAYRLHCNAAEVSSMLPTLRNVQTTIFRQMPLVRTWVWSVLP